MKKSAPIQEPLGETSVLASLSNSEPARGVARAIRRFLAATPEHQRESLLQADCHQDAILVIGYGNELRGDDAVGPRVATAVAEWKLARVRALSVHQLTPELADPISQASAVIFVDAAFESKTTETAVIALHASPQAEWAAHSSDPRALLGLAQALFNRCPPAWLIQIPVETFDFGQPLSALAERGVASAVEEVRKLCHV